MLKNLIKYEWKSVWKILIVINAFTIFATLAGMFAMYALVSDATFISDMSSVVIVLLFLFYYLTIIGVSFSMSIYIGIRFYRSLYTDEGYLMHTLPVTKRQLVISRLLVHTCCMMITGMFVMLSIVMLFLPLLSEIFATSTFSASSVITELIRNSMDAFGIHTMAAVILIWTVAGVIGQVSGILAIYCAVSLGQTFQKHKVMASILCYIGIYFLLQTINSILMMPQMVLYMGDKELNMASYLNGTLLTTSIVSLFTGIAFYLITLYIMNKKLNLD